MSKAQHIQVAVVTTTTTMIRGKNAICIYPTNEDAVIGFNPSVLWYIKQ